MKPEEHNCSFSMYNGYRCPDCGLHVIKFTEGLEEKVKYLERRIAHLERAILATIRWRFDG